MPGTILGLLIGLGLSIYVIFPADVLSLKLVNITIGDILRNNGGLVVPLASCGIGYFVDWAMGNVG